ncbi:sensor histidine kinase [Qipengyuania soli]|uniref:histidine kinase n=1 Tax=Qipengyuania soli TaxID=2782568 RepID=A0A7S8ISE5_9SPHN|nr:ATP-binding protein [Qipengyuania soli]QPC98133.1 sensor histidine kinase [Qipengyuania soli]
MGEEANAARNEAAILAASLNSELDKFSLLPMALTRDPQVKALVEGDLGEAASLNRRLETLATQSDAAAIYVMERDGRTLAASNWNLPTSFVGSNYAFRDYFKRAIERGSATQFALGTVSRKPGLYIASRIGPAGKPSGIVAVKVEFDATEDSWRRTTRGVYVTDADGVVLLASDPSWRFHILPGNEAKERDLDLDLKQFGLSKLPALEIDQRDRGGEIVQVPLVEAQQTISPAGWDLHLFVDPSPRIAAAVATGRLAFVLALAALGALAIAALLVRRRHRTREAAVVAERTAILRDQLSQANRLATLGQISAGVNHEIGQPVAALRVFAETGEKLVTSGRSDEAAANFREITRLADRIGRITGELRRFSRRNPAEPRVAAIREIIEGALLLLHDRIVSREAGILLPPAELLDVEVAAEHVRLEQVLVNLLQNALDASGPEAPVSIELTIAEHDVRLHVLDEGSGIDELQKEKLFHPFATTKQDGLGLGLVISRDIMRDLGGDLIFAPRANRTCFTMIIPRSL